MAKLEVLSEAKTSSTEDEAEETAREELAEALAKPEAPDEPSLWWLLPIWIPVLGFFMMWMAPMARTAKKILGVLFLAFIASALFSAFNDRWDEAGVPYAIGAIMLLWYSLAVIAHRFSTHGDYVARQLPEWKRAVERWEHLVYCGRCRIVYFNDARNPARPSAPVAETSSYLLN